MSGVLLKLRRIAFSCAQIGFNYTSFVYSNYLRPFSIVANASKCGGTPSPSSSSSSSSLSYAISLLQARTISRIVHRHINYHVYRAVLHTRWYKWVHTKWSLYILYMDCTRNLSLLGEDSRRNYYSSGEVIHCNYISL